MACIAAAVVFIGVLVKLGMIFYARLKTANMAIDIEHATPQGGNIQKSTDLAL
jgi:hypothetical protein